MLRPARVAQRPMKRPVSRDRRFQKAALTASIVALVAMVGFAVALNIHPSSPIPHSMVQNPVQEKSPFGSASITPATTTPGPAVKPVAAKPTAVLPQHDTAPVAKPTAQSKKPTPSRPAHHTRRNNYVADDEVIVRHYGQTQPKHPPAAQPRAGVPRYTDQQ